MRVVMIVTGVLAFPAPVLYYSYLPLCNLPLPSSLPAVLSPCLFPSAMTANLPRFVHLLLIFFFLRPIYLVFLFFFLSRLLFMHCLY